MFSSAATASGDEVVAAFVDEPMKHPEEKQNGKRYEFVNVKSASQNQS